MNVVVLNTNRSHYNANDAARESLTVGELIKRLEEFGNEAKVVFRNDNGYSYGYVTEDVVDEKWVDE